jgi:hypothetical protein
MVKLPHHLIAHQSFYRILRTVFQFFEIILKKTACVSRKITAEKDFKMLNLILSPSTFHIRTEHLLGSVVSLLW